MTLSLFPIPSMYGIFTYMNGLSFLHEWFIFMVNVGKYTIHGSYGYLDAHFVTLTATFEFSDSIALGPISVEILSKPCMFFAKKVSYNFSRSCLAFWFETSHPVNPPPAGCR